MRSIRKTEAERLHKEAMSTYVGTRNLLIAIGIIAILLAGVDCLLPHPQYRKPLADLVAATDKLALGDVNVTP